MSNKSIAKRISDLISKAREGFGRIRNGESSDEDYETVAEVLECVAAQHAEKEIETVGFSSATAEHMKDLGVKKGKSITWNHGSLDAAARVRTNKLSTRFIETKKAIKKAGISQMEELHRFVVFNYLLESIDKPSREAEQSGMEAKFSPEFHIPPIAIQSTNSPFQLKLHGYVDLVTFLTKSETSESLCSSDMHDWDKVLSVAMESSCNIEVKRQDTNLKSPHVREAVAQAMAALQWQQEKQSQRFVLTDGNIWQCGILENGVYHLSFNIDAEKSFGDERVLTILDEWVWKGNEKERNTGYWSIPGAESETGNTS